MSSKHPGFDPVDNEAFETRNVGAFPESDKVENTAPAQATEAQDDRRTPYENNNGGDSDKNRVREDRLKQLKLIQDATVGSLNWGGQKITSIFGRADNLLVYRIDGDRNDDSLRVFWSHTDDAKLQFMMTNYTSIQVPLNTVYSVIHKSANPIRVLRRIGSVIAMVLDTNEDRKDSVIHDAESICIAITSQINQEYQSLISGKLCYLCGCFSVVLLLSIASITCFLNRHMQFISDNMTLAQLTYAASFASYGGFISVSTALNSLVNEPDVRKFSYIIYGITRIIVSVLGGLFVFVVLKSGLVFKFVEHTSLFSALVFCFAAGFSEKLVPDLLKKLDVSGAEQNR